MIVGLCREGFISPESALQADPSLTRDQLQSPEVSVEAISGQIEWH